MRVAIVGVSGFDTLEDNFREAFTHLGHSAQIFDETEVLPFSPKRSRQIVTLLSDRNYSFAKWAWGRLLEKVLNYAPELVIITYRHVIPEFVKELKRIKPKVPVVHVNPDTVGTLGRQYTIASPYDAYFTKEPFWVDMMRNKLGLNAFYLPESFNPRIHAKPVGTKQECENESKVDIAVAATLYLYRVRFLELLLGLIKRPLSVAVYGGTVPWVHTSLLQYHKGKVILGADKARLFRGAKIVVNNMYFLEYEGVNCRFFEVLGSGGFLLCDHKPTLEDLAIPDKEVVTFKTVHEAAEKVDFYLEHADQRIAIAEAGYQRAIRDHTYEKRIEFILSTIKQSNFLEDSR